MRLKISLEVDFAEKFAEKFTQSLTSQEIHGDFIKEIPKALEKIFKIDESYDVAVQNFRIYPKSAAKRFTAEIEKKDDLE